MKIDEIAKKAKVSRSTVSRVLNNNPNVKAKTRLAVEKVIYEMNYVPNAAARSLVTKRSGVVGVLIYNILQPFWGSIFAGIEQELTDIGYGLLLSNSKSHVNISDFSHDYKRNLKNLLMQNMDGLIIALIDDLDSEDISFLDNSGKPYVIIQDSMRDKHISSVNIDNTKAAYEATQYLVKKGHRHIIYATGPAGKALSQDRLNGFLQSAKENRLMLLENSIMPCGFLFNDGYWCMKRILQQSPNATAVLFSNDISAYGAYHAANDEGLCIPGDLSIMGIDRLATMIDLSIFMPDLSTMTHPTSELGINAAKLLIHKINGEKETEQITLNCTLYPGSTVRDISGIEAARQKEKAGEGAGQA